MTKHKQAKARKRARQNAKDVRMHRRSLRSKNPGLDNPKPISKEEILANRQPIEPITLVAPVTQTEEDLVGSQEISKPVITAEELKD